MSSQPSGWSCRSPYGAVRRAPARGRGAPGWSLVELLIGFALLAIVAVAVAPTFSAALGGLHLRAAAVQLGAALVRGRAGALAEGRAWQLRVIDAAAYGLGPAGGEESREALPGGAAFASVTSGGTVRFAPSGTAENATFILTLAGLERRVVVNQRGRITVE